VALAVKGTAKLVQLLENPLCDVVVCALRPALMSRRSLEPPQVVYDKAADFLRLMNQVQELRDTAHISGRLELQLRVRSDHVQLQEIKKVMQSLGPVIAELRVLDRFDSCAKQLFSECEDSGVFFTWTSRQEDDATTGGHHVIT